MCMHWGEVVQLLLCMHWDELVQLLLCVHWGELVQLLMCMHWGEVVQCVNENNDGDAEAHDRFMWLHGHRWNWLHFLSVSVWCWWVLVKLWCDGQAQYEHLSMLSSSHCHVIHGRPNPHSPTPLSLKRQFVMTRVLQVGLAAVTVSAEMRNRAMCDFIFH